ncbi:MAG: folylpolyglutamate synthase/dihydrofolate synthase family protein [Candidatus Woesearchaeota archaeon]
MDVQITYDDVLKHMNSMEFSGMKLGIERIQNALALLGNPERLLKIIHITGTNGKGSVAAMLSTMLKNAGHSVGMFTSPHLVDVRERIQINDVLISKDALKETFLEAKDVLSELTFFELFTLMAVLYFVKNKVDYAIFEVGLGGTYDATNFKNSFISVITKIALDHTAILGDSVDQIAQDKCGIIKHGQKVVTTQANEQVMGVISSVARKKEAQLIVARNTDRPLSLNGQFQRENAGVAIQVAKELCIPDKVISDSLLSVRWPGRAEFIEKNVLLDCAHNPSGVDALRHYVDTLDHQRIIIVFAVSKNKDYMEMLSLLPKHDELIFTQSTVTRRLPIEDIPKGISCTRISDPIKALEHAKSISKEGDLIVVCGSIFLIGDIKAALTDKLVHDIVS